VPHASAPALEVVHSSAGRLRVHLPDPGGAVTARLRSLPGVTSAQANGLTENILILFNPRRTSEKALLAELQPARAGTRAVTLPARPAAPPAGSPAGTRQSEPPAARPVVYLTGWRRRLYRALGWTSVGLAFVGAVTPGIPTVPFVVLASYFFIRSSPKAHDWLRRSRWFGPLLRDWEEHRGVRRSVKYTALGLIGAGLTFTLLVGLPTPVLVSILALEIVGLGFVLRLRVIEPGAAAPAAPEGLIPISEPH
jgi:uncharacterized membrane protein YbaN (DUF454 family)